MITNSESSGERISQNSTDDLRHFSRAAFLLTGACNPGASVAHLVYLWVSDWTVCLALHAEGLVVRHVNQWSDTGVSI